MPTDLERLGGESAVHAHVKAIVEAFFDDMIIGFQFVGRSRERIMTHESELALRHLGASSPYTGRPIARVHGRLRINRGQFRRRLAIVQTVLADRGVPADIIERWVAHDRALESQIVDGTDCVP